MKHYRIFPAGGQRDLENALAVLKRNLAEDSSERFLWNQKCPHGRACWWLAEEENDLAPVGIAGVFPRRFLVNGSPALAAVIGDFAVDKDHRAFGPAISLQKAILGSMRESNFIFYYGMPSFRASAMMRRTGYRSLGSLVKYTKFLRTEYQQGAYLPPARLTRFLAKPLDCALAFFSKEHGYRRPATLTVETVTHCDERFDRLWAQASGDYPVIGERSSAFLNWRYQPLGQVTYQFFTLCGPGRELLGYIAFYLRDNKCRIADLFFTQTGRIGEWLLAEFLKFLRQRRIGSVTIRYWGNAGVSQLLSTFGFYRLSGQSMPIILYTGDLRQGRPVQEESQAWHLLEGDFDI